MKVEFTTRKLQKACEDVRSLSRQWGPHLGPRVGRRLRDLAAFETLEDVPTSPPFRRHQLAANRDEQFAVNLDGKTRLVFDIANDPVATSLSVSSRLTKAHLLRQAIIRRAFTGQLVPQDPNDEPASVLLERIRAARAAAPIKPGRPRRAGTR